MAQATGSDFKTGALVAGASQALAGALTEKLAPSSTNSLNLANQQINQQLKNQLHQQLATIVGGVTAQLTGEKAQVGMNIAGTADAFNRQLHEDEAQALAEQLQQIKQDASLTSLEKQNARYDAYAVVCYLTHCNAGIDSDTEQTQQLGQLKRHGEQLARQDSPVYLHFKAQQENNLFVYDGGWTGKDAWSDVFSSVDSSKVLAKFSPDYWQEHGIDNAAMSIYNAKDCPDVCISPVGALNTLEFYEPIAQELASTIVLLNESRLSAEQGEYLSALGFFTLASIDLTPGGKVGTGQVVKKVTARAGGSDVAKGALWTATKKKTGVQNAFGHWKKHGSEFPEFKNAKQYVEATKSFMNSPPKGSLTRTRSNGDVLRYHEKSNTFGIMTKDGTPRTMFKPDPSQHGYRTNLEYFNAQ